MEISAGLAITYRNSLLITHPTNAKWWNSFTIPKGWLEKAENTLETAIRETEEETGIIVPESIVNPKEHVIPYTSKDGKLYKKVFWYHCPIISLSQIGLKSEIIKKENLQLEEIDYAAFIHLHKGLRQRILRHYLPMIDLLFG